MKRTKKTTVTEPRNANKILIPLSGDDVAEERTIILSEASAEALCHLTLAEKVDTVVCCGIEEEYYQYLTWKQVKVVDSVIGSYVRILEKLKKGTIHSGDILLDRVPHIASRS
jgi:hypothetical protein